MQGGAQQTPVAIGDILAGKYEVEHILGRGGMGVVVAARHRDLDELFAIKLLLPHAVADASAVDRFLREARAAAKLKGEHVAKVTDVGRLESGSPYMVMEHLSGTDLGKHLRKVGPLPLDEAVQHILQACDAIAEAHALGIVHRDLKPANLFLIRRPNGSSCIKVLDFGISKATTDEVDLTKTGEMFGTPLYMAPEQMARAKTADPRCDIWSMGIVLHQLLVGTTPFHSTSITEVITRVLHEDPAPPSSLRPGLPPAIDAVIAKCLQKQALQRYQTVDELIAALRAVSASTGSASIEGRPSAAPLAEISRASAPMAAVFAAESGPVSASSAQVPILTRGAPNDLATGLTATTAAAWGASGHLGPAPKSRKLVALGSAAALAIALVSLGVWLMVGSAPAPSSGAGAEKDAPTSAATPAVAAQPPAVPSVEAATATSAAPTASSSAARAAPPSKKKPASAPAAAPAKPPPRFGGIY